MKHVTLLAFTALLSAAAHGQVIFTSGFEDWNAGLPTDWYGSKSNIALSGVLQVTTNVHGGSNAVQLVKEGTGHQRFTTQPQTVVANTEYEVRFWVRGEGQIRLGLYDGRPVSSGYAPYTTYTTVTGNTWQEVVLNVTAAMNAADAEFILSVQSTVAPEHLVVDDATITALEVVVPEPATIYDIQNTTNPDGSSTMIDSVVVVGGIVSALLGNGFYIQDGTGPWSGLFVFGTPGALAIGDSVAVSGTVVEFNGQTQLTSVLSIVTHTSGNTLTPTVISTLDGNTEPYESVFAKVNAATCTVQGSFGQFTVNDGSGTLLVDDVIYAYGFAVGQIYNITGVIQYAFSEWRLLPRFAPDVEVVTGIDEAAVSAFTVQPNPAVDVLRINAPIDGRTEFRLLDAAGRATMSGTLTSNTINLGEVADGRYTLVLNNASGLRHAAVIVQR